MPSPRRPFHVKPAMTPELTRAALLKLFLPFCAGYFLSYLYRTVNAVIGPVLAAELALPDNALGLLTSTYFLAFGAAQLPLGILLDRYGPRRVESALLLVASIGTVVFALADTLAGLALGRALIGLGVAACLMASFKAFALWFPPERHASLTGWVMASGGLGALAASKPLELALGLSGWREIVLGLAVVTLLVAAALWHAIPEPGRHGGGADLRTQLRGVRQIFGSAHFWRYAPMGLFMTGGFMAVQGLWASRWMAVMEGLERSAIADRLTAMGVAMLIGFLFMGFFATGLVRRGVSMDRLYRASMILAVVVFAALIQWPDQGGLLWMLLGFCFSLSNVAYSLVAQAFPSELSGRANTALNLLVFAGAFGLQWGIGIQVDVLQGLGWQAAEAYRATFLTLLVGQVLALGWLTVGRR